MSGGFKIAALFMLLIVLFLFSIVTGSVSIPVSEAVKVLTGQSTSGTYHDIILYFRLTKAVTCVLGGASLATGGLLMQSLFRNPLAGPDVLGLSSGASLLVAVLVMSGPFMGALFNNPWPVALAASLGSGATFLLVIGIAQRLRDNTSLLIIGLMISALAQSLVSVLVYVSRAEDLQAFMIWTLGTVGGTGWDEIPVLAIVSFTGFGMAWYSMKELNALLLGENYAHSMGVSVRSSRLRIVLATSLLTGGVTAFCGPIAFVGLAVPHLTRMFIRSSNHKILIPAVMAAGATLLLFCDMVAQLPGSTQILPLNAITSAIGAPVVIWMILQNKKVNI